MRRVASVVCLGAAVVWSLQSVPRIRSVRSSGSSDTLRVDFEFQGGRPEAYRIGGFQNDRGKTFLRVQIAGASMRVDDQPKIPRWMVAQTQEGIAEFRIPVYGTAPWRARWAGDTLRVELPDQLRNPIWTYPWFVGTMGAGVVAGGIALWVYGNGRDEPSRIPPPGIPDPVFTFPD
jgi:hypothetical protein